MTAEFSAFIGVEANRERSYPFTYAALDRDLTIRAFGRGSIKDAFAFLAGQDSALAAINSPMNTSKGILKARGDTRKTFIKIQARALGEPAAGGV